MPEASVQLNPNSVVPAYRQIVDQIRLHIDQGTLSSGDSLPSVRSLATQLGIHFNTAAEAYRELAEEGWIELKHGKRAVVRPARSAPELKTVEVEGLRQRLRNLVAEMRLKGIADKTIEWDVITTLQR
ncbi:GntR family transcriptional regulator [Tunturibacter psychrotolerans]|uniref:GntR family transcriptional regulator n=1 Tax=Tunturiibacter psychrotolerans TaxID=3069686 RepID=A0AAU7ZLZ5_9BACT